MNIRDFLAIPNGTRVYNHGWDQCVALANLYHESVIGGKFIAVGSAFQWWTTNQPELNRLYTRSSTPVAGAIFVARYGIYDAPNGHIGVVTGVNSNGTFNTMEQNAGTWRYVGRYTRGMANILGFWVPRNNPMGSTPPPSTSTSNSLSGDDFMRLVLDTGGTGWLVTDRGFHGLPNPQIYNLFYRVINSDQRKTPMGAVPQVPGRISGYPDRFLRAEVDMMNAQLKLIKTADAAGVSIDGALLQKELTKALKAAGSDFTVTAETEVDPEQLAAAFEAVLPRITMGLQKQK